MAATQTTAEAPGPETVWAILREVGKKQEETAQMMKESQKETARLFKESKKEADERQKEAERQMKELRESQRETAQQIKDYNKRFGEFHNRFGEIVEYMIAPKLREKFWEIGLKFHQANPNAVFSDDNKRVLFEVDILLQNGDKAMLVEVKSKPSTEDVKDHITRIEKMRSYADLHGDKRAFLGAVAGVVMSDNVKSYALEQGFYVIEPSGETFNITAPEGQPKEW